MSKRVLVTGADGFIGSHLVEALVKSGWRTSAFTYYNSFNSCGWLDSINKEIRTEVDIFSGDIRDADSVDEAARGVDYIFHLAALIGIPYSYSAPQSYIDTNITGTLNVLRVCRKNGIERLVHTSTSEVYGSAQYIPMDERHPLVGQSPYSASKIAADQLAVAFNRSFNVPVVVARPFNTYGPRQSMRAVIPTIIRQLLEGADTLSLGSIETTRDFNYVADTVSGFIGMIDERVCLGEVYNLGSGEEHSIEETARLIGDCVGVDVKFKCDPKRKRPEKSEVERLCSNSQKIFSTGAWKPTYHGKEGFKQGLRETIEWFRTNSEGKKEDGLVL